MDDFVKYSFSSANSLPMKVLVQLDVLESIVLNKMVFPVHVQFNPTNKCTFTGKNACSFCSCKNRPKKAEFPKEELMHFVDTLKMLGCKSMTITGGGEPILYPNLYSLLWCNRLASISSGLVTNGVLLDRVHPRAFDYFLTWIRISSSDELGSHVDFEKWLETVDKVSSQSKDVDWAFSHVLLTKPTDVPIRVLRLANKNKFTHVRFVNDLLKLDEIASIKFLERQIKSLKIDDKRVVYQGRKEYTHGSKKCYVSLLKPVVSAEGKLYPCCGTQYALKKPSLRYEPSMCMGNWTELPRLVYEQRFFDGSNCVRCYYDEYNKLIESLLVDYKHKRFV